MEQDCPRNDAVCASGFVLQAIKLLEVGGGGACVGKEVEGMCIFPTSGTSCTQFCSSISKVSVFVNQPDCATIGRGIFNINSFGNVGAWNTEVPGCYVVNGRLFYNSNFSSTVVPNSALVMCNCK